MAGETGATAAERFAAAHRALLADPSVQFQLPAVVPDPPPPAWVKAFGEWLERVFAPIGRLLRWLGAHMPDAPYAKAFLWTALAVAAAGLAWLLWQQVSGRRWRWPWRRAAVAVGEAAWTPETAPARAWLREADALAAEGHYAEAVHHLLIRSVEDIERRRPHLVRPAMTSRDLSDASAIPVGARRLFAGLAATVERSLFGGRAVAAEDWTACRAGYESFARGEAWTS